MNVDLKVLAERAVENGECGAQLEITDETLRESLVRNILAFGESIREEACRALYEPDERGRRLDVWTAEFAELAIRRALGAPEGLPDVRGGK